MGFSLKKFLCTFPEEGNCVDLRLLATYHVSVLGPLSVLLKLPSVLLKEPSKIISPHTEVEAIASLSSNVHLVELMFEVSAEAFVPFGFQLD